MAPNMARLIVTVLGPALANLRDERAVPSVNMKDSANPTAPTQGTARLRTKTSDQESRADAAAREARMLEEISSKMRPPGPGLLKPDKSSKYPNTKLRQNKYFSQIGQDEKVDRILQHMKDGFVVEAGAADGQWCSNSLFFEMTRNWRCLLVEADPGLYGKLLKYEAADRKCYSINAGLALDAKGGELDFWQSGLLGGFLKGYQDQKMVQTMNKKQKKSVVKVMTYPLNLMLKSIGVKTVDYFSLDTEGSEAGVIATIDFNATEFGVITIEGNGEGAKMNRVDKILGAANFLRLNRTKFGGDGYYANRAYFKKRNLSLAGLGALGWGDEESPPAPLNASV